MALADPTRRHIVEMLSAGELSAGEISSRFKISAPAISQHLKALKQARLVRVRVEAQKRIYTLDAEGLSAIDEFLAKVRACWNPRLDALERELKAAAEKDQKHE